MEKCSLKQIKQSIKKPWIPVEVARFNNQVLRVAIFEGEYHWHSHENEDEFFLVYKGSITINTEIAQQGGYVTTVSTLEDGVWKTYVQRGDKQFSGDDFAIALGKAYFVKTLKRSIFLYQGQELVEPIQLSLNSGWNAVGFPKMSKSYKIGDIIDALNAQNAQAETAARYESGNWDAFVKIPEEFGNNFLIENKRGYVIRINQDTEFTP